MWQTVLNIPKGKEDLWEIGLSKVLWKAIASLLNRRLTAAIFFHDTIHGFRAGLGMGTFALKTKLLQHLTATREAVLFEIFLYLWKAYNTLYQ